MSGPEILSLTSFLVVMVVIYLFLSKRNLIKIKPLTLPEYLWKLKQIIDKSEYEIFHIAAEEKGWPAYQVERHFKRYLQDQTLPAYVKAFLEDGKEYIDAYRSKRGDFLNKKALIFFSLFALLVIGSSFFICLYIIPRYFPFDHLENEVIERAIQTNPRLAQSFINRAISYGEKGQKERACSDLKLLCDFGYCKYYTMKIREGECR